MPFTLGPWRFASSRAEKIRLQAACTPAADLIPAVPEPFLQSAPNWPSSHSCISAVRLGQSEVKNPGLGGGFVHDIRVAINATGASAAKHLRAHYEGGKKRTIRSSR